MKQENVVRFVSDDGKLTAIIDSDTPLGLLHDHLMMLKGVIVEKMQNAQKQEEEIAKKMMGENESK